MKKSRFKIFLGFVILLIVLASCNLSPVKENRFEILADRYVTGKLLFNIECLYQNDSRMILPVAYNDGHVLILDSTRRTNVLFDIVLPGKLIPGNYSCNDAYTTGIQDNLDSRKVLLSFVSQNDGANTLSSFVFKYVQNKKLDFDHTIKNKDYLKDYTFYKPENTLTLNIGEYSMVCAEFDNKTKGIACLCQSKDLTKVVRYGSKGEVLQRHSFDNPIIFSAAYFYNKYEFSIAGYDGNYLVYFNSKLEPLKKYQIVRNKLENSFFVNYRLYLRSDLPDEDYICFANLCFMDSTPATKSIPKLLDANGGKYNWDYTFVPTKEGLLFVTQPDKKIGIHTYKVSDEICDYIYVNETYNDPVCILCLFKLDKGYECKYYSYDDDTCDISQGIIQVSDVGNIDDEVYDLGTTFTDTGPDGDSFFVFGKTHVYKIKLSKQDFKKIKMEYINTNR